MQFNRGASCSIVPVETANHFHFFLSELLVFATITDAFFHSAAASSISCTLYGRGVAVAIGGDSRRVHRLRGKDAATYACRLQQIKEVSDEQHKEQL